jgi:hypothetical protein
MDHTCIAAPQKIQSLFERFSLLFLGWMIGKKGMVCFAIRVRPPAFYETVKIAAIAHGIGFNIKKKLKIGVRQCDGFPDVGLGAGCRQQLGPGLKPPDRFGADSRKDRFFSLNNTVKSDRAKSCTVFK